MTHDPPPGKKEVTDGDSSDQFLALLMEHRHRLYAFIAKQLVNNADVEDVFQKTTIVLWRKMDDFDESGSFFHWASGIAFNEVRNFVRIRQRNKLRFDVELIELLAEEAQEEAALSDTRLDALRECLKQVSPRQREILRRCYMGSETISDVANRLGRKRDAFYKQLARLREKLSNCIRHRLRREGGVA